MNKKVEREDHGENKQRGFLVSFEPESEPTNTKQAHLPHTRLENIAS